MKKIIAFLLALVITLLCFAGCGKNEEETTQPSTETTQPTTEADEEPQGNLNLLTGRYTLSDEAVGKRPMAVMINNIKQSLPQYGISKA
ncbi:MAG: DUF3048 domain-containing protein, partial [Acutalibacteraceae bacterium]